MASAIAAIFLWASLAALAFKLSHLPPFFLTGIGMIIGSFALAPGLTQWRVPWRTFAIGVLALTLYHAALFAAFQWAPAVSANLINYLWPLLIVVLAPWVQPGEKLTLRIALAGVVGFAGAALAIVGDRGLHFEKRAVFGYILALAAALIWSVYSLSLRRLPAFPNAAVGLFNLGAGILSLWISAVAESWPRIQSEDWPYLCAIGAGPLGLAFFFWDRAAKTLPPRQLGVLSFLTPVLSTALLFLITQQMPTQHLALAALLVILAIGIATSRGKND
ncbi:MAG: DMT family transporter [Turneriella sp.]|nr:DMT family transporter [Turneriella sp.]